MNGFLRTDGRKGIRNIIVVVYLVECAHHVAREIVYPVSRARACICSASPAAIRMPTRIACCASFARTRMSAPRCSSRSAARASIARSCSRKSAPPGRPAGSARHPERRRHPAHHRGRPRWIEQARAQARRRRRAWRCAVEDLIVGTVCGGSDATSGITANPAVGRAFDLLVENGARVIFEETGELIGCEQIMAARAARRSSRRS